MSKKKLFSLAIALCMVLSLLLTACAGPAGPAGPQGDPGPAGPAGPAGEDGKDAVSQNGDEYVMSPDIVESLFVSEGGNGNFQYNGKFYTDYATLAEAQTAAHALAVTLAAEGIVLLKNDNALPLTADEKDVTLLGIRTARMIRSGFGSGAGGGSAISTLLVDAMRAAGYNVNPKPVELYNREIGLMREDLVLELGQEYYGPSITSTYAAYGDAAILTFSRTGAENYDLATNNAAGHANPDDHFLMLDDNEVALVKHAKAHFDKVIVLINSSNIMQIPELDEPKTADNLGVDAILWVGGVGQDGCTAIAHILNGDITPSGHTVDLWEKDFTKAPTFTNFGLNTQNKDANGNRMDTFFYDENGNITKFANLEYREGIYYGYKFYETKYFDAEGEAAKEEAYSNVLYPFGYGLSYTDFEWKLDNVKVNDTITAAGQSVTVRVWVKNVGDVAGKDVVQVYVNPPYTKGGIEKASANLMGFAKTKLLQPGESDVVTITFYAQDFASFDWNDANGNGFKGYELEAGDYIININRNSHDTVLSVTRTINETILCKTDLYTGEVIEPVFVGDFSSVNESLLNGMISRATGLVQPEPASKEDRTLDAATLADYESQAQYFSYMDEETDPWYVAELPSSWTQSTDKTAELELTLADMAGVTYTEPYIDENNVLVIATDADSQKWDEFMNQFTWEELCSLPANPNNIIERLGAISYNANGAASYKYGDPDGPINAGGIQFPSNPIVCATFNQELAYELGVIEGSLLLLNGSRGWRGTGADIHRTPFSGRNFEYFSEDGVMSGIMAGLVTLGVTEKGIISHTKHFFGNDQETFRADYGGVFTWATEQTLREQTMKPFEYIVKYGKTLGLMNSFNRIGKWTISTNYAVHETLLNVEWNFQGSCEGDAWAKQFVPLNLGVRGGDDELLSADSSYPPCALERGWWDAEANCVRVAANADEYESYNSGVGTMLSPTHYFAVRKCAQRLLQSMANSSVNNNGFDTRGEGEVVEIVLTKNIYNQIALSIPGKTTDAVFKFAEGTQWPAGMSFNATTGILSGVPTGAPVEVTDAEGNKTSVEVTEVAGTFDADNWLKNLKVKFVFSFESDIQINGENITDGKVINLKVGQAYNATVAAEKLTYGSQLAITNASNRRIMNVYMGIDGAWYHRDEDKSAADIVTLGDMEYDEASSKIYHVEVLGLPEGLKAEDVITMEMGWAARSAYEVATAAKISGAATTAGTYEVTINIYVPHVSKGTNPWMRAAGTTLTVYTQTITIVVE